MGPRASSKEADLIRTLSFHAEYACRHSGACCTSGWPIPVDVDELHRMKRAIANGTLAVRGGGERAFVAAPPPVDPEAPVTLQVLDGACVMYDRGARRCGVQRALGHAVLPLACRQFPRVSLLDPRGTSVTLSHYCPTAAGLLEADLSISIVSTAPAFPQDGEYVGLDARRALPPLLRPDMAMDWGSWWECERLAVETLATSGASAAEAVADLERAVDRIRSWRPSDGPLVDRVRTSFTETRGRPTAASHSPETRSARADALVRSVYEAVPAEHRPGELSSASAPPNAVLRRFLAAHAFANWSAYLGEDLRTWVRSIQAAHALAGAFGVRQADLLLRHLVDPAELAKELGG